MLHDALLTEKDVTALLACKPHVVRRLPIKKVYLQTARKRKDRYTRQAVNAYLRSIGVTTSKSTDVHNAKRPRKNVHDAGSRNVFGFNALFNYDTDK